jgi:hypothetical protein
VEVVGVEAPNEWEAVHVATQSLNGEGSAVTVTSVKPARGGATSAAKRVRRARKPVTPAQRAVLAKNLEKARAAKRRKARAANKKG